MLSLRSVAQACLGVTGDLSVNTHVYGYPFKDASGRRFGALVNSDVLIGTGAQATRSLASHLDQIRGNAINIAVILVGHEYDMGQAGATSAVELSDVVWRHLSMEVDEREPCVLLMSTPHLCRQRG